MIDPAEHALFKISQIIDDLTSMAQRPQFAAVIANHDWPATMRRIVDLKGDADEIVQSQKQAAE